MKLLLTSAGFTNKSIANALLDLTGRPFSELKLVFIPTAANIEEGGKEWLIDDLYNCKKLGFKQIEICDISALPQEIIFQRLTEADIIFVGGGNTYYLFNWLIKSGLRDKLEELLKTKVYVGLSAGSMVTCKYNYNKVDEEFYFEKQENIDKYESLGFVNFFIMVHANSVDFPKVTEVETKLLSERLNEVVYMLDNQSAIKVDGEKIEVVSEGNWKKFN